MAVIIAVLGFVVIFGIREGWWMLTHDTTVDGRPMHPLFRIGGAIACFAGPIAIIVLFFVL